MSDAITNPLGLAGRRWRRALVVGLGLSGKAAARLLLSRGVETWGVDRQAANELGIDDLLGAGLHWLAGESAALPDGLDVVVVSPGVSPRHPLVARARSQGLAVIGEIELAFPLLRGPMVAITGSNGKSTTTALTGAMLTAAGFPVVVCGNIGVPLASVVDAPGPGPDERIFVVELSSYQLETIKTFRPRAAAILNVSPDHLERHGDLESYAAAKRAITRRQEEDDTLVLNADDPRVSATPSRARRRFFSRTHEVADGAWIRDGVAIDSDGLELFTVGNVNLPGPHNLENALAAALLARALGAPPEAIQVGLHQFEALPHRTERFAEAGGVTFVDDSKGTNLDSTARALEGFADGSVHLILGGRDKGGDYAQIGTLVARKARRLYLIGEAAETIAARLGDQVEIERSGTLDRAVEAAVARAQDGDTVLLSPACSSFDQFRDFNHRGDEFQRLVREALPGRAAGKGL